jgi:nitrogen regulatory protein PII
VVAEIIESDLKTQVKIETRDGSIFVYSFDEIERVSSEDADN